MALEQLIAACIARKEGNKEFALFYFEEGHWNAEIGNQSMSVNLGEIPGEVGETGSTAVEAVQKLLDTLNTAPIADGSFAAQARYLKWLKGEGKTP